ncbi:MAG: alpha/beta hydrolase, partial [Candidatus Nanopelagicales bacterium]
MTSPSALDDLGSVPGWFSAAIAHAPEHVDIPTLGVNVHARVWGDRSHPGLVLVHGGSAHSGWWDHIAPLLAKSHRVVAIDLSGHGDSGRRESYDMVTWSQEVMAVAAALVDGPPIVIGHSMGGGVALAAAVENPETVDGLIVIDTPLDPRHLERDGMREALRPPRIYAAFEDAVARFRTIPEQAVVLPYVGRHVAEQSLKQVEGGWTWKYDPNFFNQTRARSMREMLANLQCPSACFRAEFGLVTQQMVDGMREVVGNRIPVIELPQSGHHPMLDQPLALAAAISTALGLWMGPR